MPLVVELMKSGRLLSAKISNVLSALALVQRSSESAQTAYATACSWHKF